MLFQRTKLPVLLQETASQVCSSALEKFAVEVIKTFSFALVQSRMIGHVQPSVIT